MTMTRNNRATLSPFQLLDEIRDRLERGLESGTAGFPLDVIEEGDHLLVMVNLPGVRPDSVNLSLENNTLTLSAQLEDDGGENRRYLYRERPSGTVRRAVTLPVRLNPERTQASLENGVLTVRVDKAPEATARRIQVQGGGASRVIESGRQGGQPGVGDSSETGG